METPPTPAQTTALQDQDLMYERMKAPFFACIAAIAVGGIEILFGVKNPLRVSIMFLAFGVTSSIILERKQYGRIEPL